MPKPGAKISVSNSKPKLALAVVPKLTSSLIEDSLDGENYRLVIHGPPGVGKTFCALSGSDFWPNELPAKKPINLADTLHVCFDQDAAAGLGLYGIRVPTINVTKLLTPLKPGENRPFAKSILDALNMIATEVRAAVETGGIKNVVIDTVSTLDKELTYYWDKNCPITKSGAKDTRAMWTLLGITHTRFHRDMKLIAANMIFLCHSKAVIEADSKEGQDQAKKNRAIGLSDIIVDVTGKSISLYTGNPTAIFYMTKTKNLTGKGFSRTVHTIPTNGVLSKNRWEAALDEEEEANLGDIIRKVRKAQDLAQKGG